jgi:hypothetical protein
MQRIPLLLIMTLSLEFLDLNFTLNNRSDP